MSVAGINGTANYPAYTTGKAKGNVPNNNFSQQINKAKAGSVHTLPGGARQNVNVQVDRQESEAKTEIIAKPDGSRVLVMTMSIGGMETTMSLEISKPTEAPNGNSKQDSPVPGRWKNRGAEAALNDRGEIDGNGGLIK